MLDDFPGAFQMGPKTGSVSPVPLSKNVIRIAGSKEKTHLDNHSMQYGRESLPRHHFGILLEKVVDCRKHVSLEGVCLIRFRDVGPRLR